MGKRYRKGWCVTVESSRIERDGEKGGRGTPLSISRACHDLFLPFLPLILELLPRRENNKKEYSPPLLHRSRNPAQFVDVGPLLQRGLDRGEGGQGSALPPSAQSLLAS